MFTKSFIIVSCYYNCVQVMKNDKSWRGMLLKDNEGDWGVAVAAWRGMKKGQPGVPGCLSSSFPLNYLAYLHSS